MAHLSLAFFGGFTATLNAKPLTKFRSVKVQGLLIYLALTPRRPHSRDVLASIFWPDVPQVVAKKNLRQSLYQLRQVLGDTAHPKESFLLVTRSTLQFNSASNYALDVSDFLTHLDNNQLEQAVAIYQGDLLPGFCCAGQPFDEWLLIERERLHRLALDALYELTEHSLAITDFHKAQELAQRQLVLEPWREEAHRQLMQALTLLGKRSAALAQYQVCRKVLNEELGVEPSVKTRALAARIRDQQLEPSGRHEPALSFERRQMTTPFVGRKTELSALVTAYQRTKGDGAQVVALVGEAGIGKTRLAQFFLDWATTQGADTMIGRTFETSGRLSYQPLTQMLRQRMEHENAPEDLLSDLWLTQLTRILPELRDRYPDLPEPTQEEVTARQHLFEAITRLAQALAERAPLVLFIDDWHWADAASLDVLHYAALRWSEEQTPILMLLTLSQEELTESPELRNWLARLEHDVACKQLNLAALSQPEIELLTRTLLVPEEDENSTLLAEVEKPERLTRFNRWLFEETDGQPFFLVETLKALVEEGLIRPDTHSETWLVDWPKLDEQALQSEVRDLPRVQEIIRGWLDRITAPASEVLRAAAVLDQEASFDNLCSVAGLEEIEALTAVDELLARQLLLEVDEASLGPSQDVTYSFSHQKLGKVVYLEAGAARRRLLHQRAFKTLQAANAPAAELAHHALNAGFWNEAIQNSIDAGNDAMNLFAVRVAIVHYETAWRLAESRDWPKNLSSTDRRDLFANLGRAYELIESWQQAQETYLTMISFAQTTSSAAMKCLGLNRLAIVYINGFNDPQQAIVYLEEARTVAEGSDDQQGLAETEWTLSVAARSEQKIFLALRHGERALAISRQLEHPQLLARCLNALAYIHSVLRHWDTVEEYAEEARKLYASDGNRILEADSQRLVGWSQLHLGRPHDSLATLRETYAFSQQIENLWGEAECAWRLALTLLDLGHYGEAIRMAKQAVKQARKIGIPAMVFLSLSTWGTVHRTVMALSSTKETLLEILERTIEKSVIGFMDWVLAELCVVHAMIGDWDQAYDYARRTLQFREDNSVVTLSLTSWYESEALVRGGDSELAKAEVDRLNEIVGDNQRYRLPLLRSLAVLAQWDGDTDHAVAHLQAALELARDINLPGEEWSILGALGDLFADQGDLTKAQKSWKTSAGIILSLAETIDDEELKAGFLTAGPVRSRLASGDMGPIRA